MKSEHQARWITKPRIEAVRKAGRMGQGILLDSVSGFIVIEPIGSDLGDGPILSPQEADYELNPAWCSESNAKLRQARRLVGLETGMLIPAG